MHFIMNYDVRGPVHFAKVFFYYWFDLYESSHGYVKVEQFKKYFIRDNYFSIFSLVFLLFKSISFFSF